MDTIFALASAPGKAGVAIVRVSGPEAWTAAERLAGYVPQPRITSLRNLRDANGGFLDQAMVVAFEHGASFTGERVVEFHLHGSVAVIKAVLSELAAFEGFRTAEAGEFTRRALENGNLDLTQVEALSDLIEAETDAQRKQAVAILTGALSERVLLWREDLIRAAALLAVTIDFVDEDVPLDVSEEVLRLLTSVYDGLTLELSGLQAAERIRTGFEIAIVGPPNAGKSTLLNNLAGRDAAITSDIAGTTRDVIEVRMEVHGLAVTFLDTAGLRETDDPIEKLGVARARKRAEAADLRVHLLAIGETALLEVKPEDITLVPKQDSGPQPDGISGHTGYGVPALLHRIAEVLAERVSNAGLASRERHRVNLEKSSEILAMAISALRDEDFEVDLVSEDIRLASQYLETLVGKVNVEHLLDEIFSSFCIGK